MACMLFFLWLHILGARFIYSFVPYDDWSIALFGSSISEWFAWERNHYDRLVHFAFGALFMAPAVDVATRYGRMTTSWAILFGVLFVMAMSAWYEAFEWLLTVVVSPLDAESYNGQQGDLWDAQKDMALAFLGSLMAIPPVLVWIRRKC